jgi:uncharacterized protein (DUF488 family)
MDIICYHQVKVGVDCPDGIAAAYVAPIPVVTWGYGNRPDYDRFESILKRYGVGIVVDVRKSPRAWTRRWYGDQIRAFCESQGIQYSSKPALGNTSGKAEWIPPDREQADIALGEVAAVARQNTTLLLCSEKNSAHCHRTEVAQQLGPEFKVIHLW